MNAIVDKEEKKVMKKLSDFKNEEGMKIAGDVMAILMRMIMTDKKDNKETKEDKDPFDAFTCWLKEYPTEMMHIFAILSEEDPNTYECDGATAILNMLILANDAVIQGLFQSAK